MQQQKADIVNCLAGHYRGEKFATKQLEHIDETLLRDPVVAIHCKAGKGRTGLLICCYMLFTELFGTVEESLSHYDRTRTHNEKALTIESQRRQVYHFKHFLERICVGPNQGDHFGDRPQAIESPRVRSEYFLKIPLYCQHLTHRAIAQTVSSLPFEMHLLTL